MLKNVNDCLVSLSNALEEQESLLLNAQRDAMRRCEENEPVIFFSSMILILRGALRVIQRVILDIMESGGNNVF